jgi:hypothetical protein
MNVRQAQALANHCRFAFEALNPKLSYEVPTGRVILTVASGYE